MIDRSVLFVFNHFQRLGTCCNGPLNGNLPTDVPEHVLQLVEVAAPLQLDITIPRTVARRSRRPECHDTHLEPLGFRLAADLKAEVKRRRVLHHDRFTFREGRGHPFADFIAEARQSLKDRLAPANASARQLWIVVRVVVVSSLDQQGVVKASLGVAAPCEAMV